MKVMNAIADIFKAEGVDYVFGQTGGHMVHFWEAIADAQIGTIVNKQEGNAGYMADGYTRASGKPAAVAGTAGPGATNMLTAMATAHLDSVPLIAIGGAARSNSFGRNPIQDGSGRGRAIDQRLAFKAVTKQAMLAPTPEATPATFREAFRVAYTGRPGPVYVEIPWDFWCEEIDYQRVPPEQYKSASSPRVDPELARHLYERLIEAKSPLIVVGEGALKPATTEMLTHFLDATGVPFAVSPLAKNLVDEYHPLYLGVMRAVGGTQKVYEYARSSDLVLFLGDRMQEWEVNWYDDTLFREAKLIQVDPDPEEIGRVYPVDASAVGSVLSFIESIACKAHYRAHELSSQVEDLWSRFPRRTNLRDGDGINPLSINNFVEETLATNGTVVADAGFAKSMAVMKFRTTLMQTFIVADKNGPMGYAAPAAIGAALATGGEIVCFVGDGGFQMSLNELGTAMNYGLKVIFVIQDNGGCASIAEYHRYVYGRSVATDFNNPRFDRIAEAYGMKGYYVSTTLEFQDAFAKAQKDETSVIIHAKVDQSLMEWS